MHCSKGVFEGFLYKVLGFPGFRGFSAQLPAFLNLNLKKEFFCSNALIALARSLCKYLLAVLITASKADTVAGFMYLWCQAV